MIKGREPFRDLLVVEHRLDVYQALLTVGLGNKIVIFQNASVCGTLIPASGYFHFDFSDNSN
jgi:hypothetical protein